MKKTESMEELRRENKMLKDKLERKDNGLTLVPLQESTNKPPKCYLCGRKGHLMLNCRNWNQIFNNMNFRNIGNFNGNFRNNEYNNYQYYNTNNYSNCTTNEEDCTQ